MIKNEEVENTAVFGNSEFEGHKSINSSKSQAENSQENLNSSVESNENDQDTNLELQDSYLNKKRKFQHLKCKKSS